jgi:hypothetical protein
VIPAGAAIALIRGMVGFALAAPTYIARLAALGLALTGVGVLAVRSPAPAPLTAPALTMTDEIALQIPTRASAAVEAPPPAAPASPALVFTARGKAWMKLEALAHPSAEADASDAAPRRAFPRHGRPTHTTEDGVEIVVAPVAREDLPAADRDRLGAKVLVDGACSASITGFAIVSRLTGDTSYAGVNTDAWTVDSVLGNGEPVLAASLDGCEGGQLGQLQGAATRMRPVTAAREIARARALVIASPAGRDASDAWHESNATDSDWATDPDTRWDVRAFTHPRTGAIWISIHAHNFQGCGGADVNVWGLYRVDAGGALVATDVNLGNIVEIDELIDLDGDGVVEVVGHEWLGARVIQDAHGAELDRLELPFYGCAC